MKRIVGDVLEVWADIFGDGHDKLQARIKYRTVADADWSEAPMEFFDNDRWIGRIPAGRQHRLSLHHRSLARSVRKLAMPTSPRSATAEQDLRLELQEGRLLVQKAAQHAHGRYRETLEALLAHADTLRDRPDELAELLLAEELHLAVVRCAERTNASRYPRELEVIVDRQAALYSAWYELMPRSQSGTTERGGTFDDVIARLPYVREMGFDVLYFPPIHPDRAHQPQGPQQQPHARPERPGQPLCHRLGGGRPHGDPSRARHARGLQATGALRPIDHGLEIALDFAIQCSPDHPWIKEHPEWFDWRPDGTIKFAENPPKKYEDIVNLHFYREAYPAVWHALRDVVLFWIEQGVKIFRVDNPHTKPLPFWEWMIDEVRRPASGRHLPRRGLHPAEDDEAPGQAGLHAVLHLLHLAHDQAELTEYLTELTQEEPKEYYRPNFFANTPDINPVHLQTGGRPAFIVRATLAATLSSVYGIYSGFELCEAAAIPGKEEYLNSEKYEIKAWDWNRPGNIRASHHAAQPPSGATTRRCTSCATCASTTPSTTRSCSTAR